MPSMYKPPTYLPIRKEDARVWDVNWSKMFASVSTNIKQHHFTFGTHMLLKSAVALSLTTHHWCKVLRIGTTHIRIQINKNMISKEDLITKKRF